MKLPRDLSGSELASLLCRHWGYSLVHQRGSHIILETNDPIQHRLSIPAHDSLRIGTLNTILKAVSRHRAIPRQDLLDSLNR